MAGMTGFITDVLAMGPAVAQGLTLTQLPHLSPSAVMQSAEDSGFRGVR
jgi:hypothetical protein